MEYENIKKLKKQWLKKHIVFVALISLEILGIYILGAVFQSYLLIGVNTIYAFIMYCVARNSQDSFVEENRDEN